MGRPTTPVAAVTALGVAGTDAGGGSGDGEPDDGGRPTGDEKETKAGEVGSPPAPVWPIDELDELDETGFDDWIGVVDGSSPGEVVLGGTTPLPLSAARLAWIQESARSSSSVRVITGPSVPSHLSVTCVDGGRTTFCCLTEFTAIVSTTLVKMYS
jgi:hypothetical protein